MTKRESKSNIKRNEEEELNRGRNIPHNKDPAAAAAAAAATATAAAAAATAAVLHRMGQMKRTPLHFLIID